MNGVVAFHLCLWALPLIVHKGEQGFRNESGCAIRG